MLICESADYFKKYFITPLAFLPPQHGNSSEPTDDGQIESQIVPPAGVIRLIDVNARLKGAVHERCWGDPPVPHTGEKSRLPFFVIIPSARKTSREEEGAGE